MIPIVLYICITYDLFELGRSGEIFYINVPAPKLHEN